MKFKPQKPYAIKDIEELRVHIKFPCYVQYKYDGIRCIIKNGKVLSNTLKEIPNVYIREKLTPLCKVSLVYKTFFDGELILRDYETFKNLPFNQIQSAVMSRDGCPEHFNYVLFDEVNDPAEPYENRLFSALLTIASLQGKLLQPLTMFCSNWEDFLEYEQELVTRGAEGVIIRSLDGKYKSHARGTLKEGALWKFKRFSDAEGRIIGFEELLFNNNLPTIDARGLTKRSSHQDNLEPSGMLGSFIVKGIKKFDGVIFKVSAGSLTHRERRNMWAIRKTLMDKVITYIYAKSRPGVNAPLEPRFKTFRDERDL